MSEARPGGYRKFRRHCSDGRDVLGGKWQGRLAAADDVLARLWAWEDTPPEDRAALAMARAALARFDASQRTRVA